MLDVSQDVPLFIIKQAVISHVRVSALQFLTIDIKRLCDLLCDYIELLRQLEQANPQRYPFDSSVAMLLPLLRTLKFYTHFVLNQPEHMERFAALPGYNDNSQTQTLFPSIMNSMLAEGKPAGDLLIQLLSCGVFKSFSLWREKYQGLLSYVSHTGNVNASASTVFSPKKKASKKSSNVRLFTQTGRSSSPRPAKKKKVSPKIPSDRNVVKDSLRQSFSSVAKSSKVVHTNELIIEAGVSQSDLLERITQSHRKIVRRLTTLGVIALEQESSEDDLSSAACGSSPTL